MKRNVFKGTIAGILIGAVAGILLAPKSGKDTQNDIKRKVKGATDDAHKAVERLNNEVSARIDYLKDASLDLKGEAQAESKTLIKRAEEFRRDAAKAAESFSKDGVKAKESAVKNAKRLMAEGAEVLRELERVTKVVGASAKDKANGLKDTPAAKEPASDDKTIIEAEEQTKRRRKHEDDEA